jgi:uncharacterized protein involved in exopolysaccharide biosynthesis
MFTPAQSEGLFGSAAPSAIELLAHCYVLRRRAAAICGSTIIIFAIFSALLAPDYKAAATLAVLPSPEFTVRPDAGSNALNASALAMDQIMKAETEILESDDLHTSVLTNLGVVNVYPDLADTKTTGLLHTWLRPLASPWLGSPSSGPGAFMERALRRFASDLDVRASKDGNVIDVTFVSADGEKAARVCNELLAMYATRRTRIYDDPQLRVVSREAEEVGRAAISADSRLAAFKAAHTISDYDGERSFLLKRKSDAQQGLAEATMSISEQRARISALGAQINGQSRVTDIFIEHDMDTRLQAIDATLVDLRAKLGAAQVHYLDTSRVVADLRAQIATRMEERTRLVNDPSPSIARLGPNPTQEQLKLDQARAAAELAAASSRASSEERLIADLAEALVATDANERELEDLERQKRVADDNFITANRVMAERHLTEAEDTLRLANVRVIEAAHVPQRPGPLKLLLVMAGVLFGLVSAVTFLVWSFAARPTFLTPHGLSHATGLPVLGAFRLPNTSTTTA